MQEHSLPVKRTARYYMLGEPNKAITTIWYVCHGYAQLARHFIRNFRSLDNGNTLIVAPEALSRFYSEGFTGRVGASWMTKEDRLAEIDDYVTYLDELHRAVSEKLAVHDSGNSARIIACGFSQGTATAARWAAHGQTRIDDLVLWGGLLPPKLLEERGALPDSSLTLVHGRKDEFRNQERITSQLERLQHLQIPHTLIEYDGGHTIEESVLHDVNQHLSAMGVDRTRGVP